MIRQDAAMPVSRFAALIGIGRRTCHRWQANAGRTGRAKGPWPAPVVEAVEPLAAKYADDWPGWGHRKIYGLIRAEGHTASASSVLRAMRRRGLLQPIDYQGQRRELAKARKGGVRHPTDRPEAGMAAGLFRVRDHHRRHVAAGRLL